MEAGYGAEQQASRRAMKVARLRREAEAGVAASSLVATQLELAQRQQRAWAQGAEGERLVAATLDSVGAFGWAALHDLRWPGRRLANVDHIAIGPGGIVVIDAKHWTGDVTLTDGTLRQNGYRRDRELDGVAAATSAVRQLFLPEYQHRVCGVLCLVDQEQEPVAMAQGVTVVGRLQLPSLLVGLPPLMTPFEVADVGRYLYDTLGGRTSSRVRSGRSRSRAARAGAGRGSPIRGQRILAAVVASAIGVVGLGFALQGCINAVG